MKRASVSGVGVLALLTTGLLAALPLAIATEGPSVPGRADAERIAQSSDRASPASLTMPFGLSLEGRLEPMVVSPAGEAPEECWIVDQWIDPNQGHPQLCTKWECKDSRTWIECVPI